MTYRNFAFVVAVAIVAATSTSAIAQGGKWTNQFGRYFGYGYSDGYHAPKPEGRAVGESVLVDPAASEPHLPVPAPPAAADTGPIEPRREWLPRAPIVKPLPSVQMTPSPSTTGDAPQLRPRNPSRPSGQAFSRLKARERKAGDTSPETEGLTAPDVEGPSLELNGPALAPSAVPAADGSIAPYPEAPPATPSPITNQGATRPRYLLPPR